MIARIDSAGLNPVQVAEKFASSFFDGPREVEVSTFCGVHGRQGFAGIFRLVDGVTLYGIRWFKRRGRVFAFYTRSDLFHRVGALHAKRGKRHDWRGNTPEEMVSYLDGYVDGLPVAKRRKIETDIYTRIDTILYE
jgi:hypothetical protein